MIINNSQTCQTRNKAQVMSDARPKLFAASKRDLGSTTQMLPASHPPVPGSLGTPPK